MAVASPLALIVGSSFNQIVFANAKEWQRERKMKKGARIAMQRALQFMQHQPLSAPGHGIPCPFFGRRRLRCPPSRFDRHHLSSLGKNLDEPCKCWEWKYVPHYVAIPPIYLRVYQWYGHRERSPSIQTHRHPGKQQHRCTRCLARGPAVNSGDRQAGCRKRGCSRRRGWISERQTAGRRRLQACLPGEAHDGGGQHNIPSCFLHLNFTCGREGKHPPL